MKRKYKGGISKKQYIKKRKINKQLLLYSGPEVKNLDIALSTTEFNTTGVIVPINIVPIGTGSDERIGSKITLKSMYFRGTVAPTSATTGNTLARIILIYDKQTNAAAPAVTAILNTANSRSQLNKDNRDRFEILMDKCYPVGGNQSGAGYAVSPSFFSVKKFKKLKDRITQFNQTNGSTIADITTGGLYLLFVGDISSGTTTASCNYTVRVNYTDK